MRAYHFLRNSRRLGFDDGRLVEVGQTLTVGGEPVLCEHGLHASVDILDAVKYANGPIFCEVELGGTIIEGDDKVVATERTCLSMRDVTRELRLGAVYIARRAVARVKNPDPRILHACDVAERYANGEATGEELWDIRMATIKLARAARTDVNKTTWVAVSTTTDCALHAMLAARRSVRNIGRIQDQRAELEAQRKDLVELLNLSKL